MASKRRKKRSPIVLLVTFLMALIIYLGAAYIDYSEIDTSLLGFDIGLGDMNVFGSPAEDETESEIKIPPTPLETNGEVLFHFIDVGQGDAILITTPDGNMLVDTGVKSARDELVAYLDKVGVTDFEYLVLTHPDADHIGNADYIIDNYEIKNILITDCVSTSKTYERMLTAMENSSANVICPEPGYTFSLGGSQNTVIAPNKKYGDPNEMSIVFKSVFGVTSVMLTGDAERDSEEDIVNIWSAEDLKSTILKAGHHGSSTSSSQKFLDAVDPDIVVISCGEGNTYGHPHDETMKRYENMGLEIYRTDTDGTIVFKTDGVSFTLVE